MYTYVVFKSIYIRVYPQEHFVQRKINTEITKLMSFIEQIMQSLWTYNEKLKDTLIQIKSTWKYFKLIKALLF